MTEGSSDREPGRNGYIDLVAGSVPEEIADFTINNDPYANVLGTSPRTRTATHLWVVPDEHAPDEVPTRLRHPWLTAISIVMIVVWIVIPAGLVIMSHIGALP